MVRETLIPWQDGENADANVIIEVRNISSSAIDLVAAADSDGYTVTDNTGNVFAAGSPTSFFPYEVAPGEIGFIAGEVMVGGGADFAQMVHVTSDTTFKKATLKDIVLTVSATTNKPGSDGRRGASTSGMVTNTSKTDVEEVDVGAFYYDSAGNLLGYSYGGPSNLKAGQTTAFVTDTGSPPLLFNRIARTVVIADSLCRPGPCLP